MPQRCRICTHKNRPQIEQQILDPEASLRDVAKTAKISIGSIHRHKTNHMDPSRVQQKVAEQEAIAELPTGSASAYERIGLRVHGGRIQKFVMELVADPAMQYTRAAERAGWAAGNTSRSMGSKLMKDPEVRQAVDEKLEERQVRTKVSADRILQEMAIIATAEVSDFLEWEEDGSFKLKPSRKLGPERRAIQGFRTVGDKVLPVLHPKGDILKMLGAHLGLTTEKTEAILRIIARDPATGEDVPLRPPRAVKVIDVGKEAPA